MKRLFVILVLFFTLRPGAGAQEEYAIPVKPGDSSSTIIESYLNGLGAWDKVVEYNQLLRPGNLVKVPSQLVNLEGKAYISLIYGEGSVRLAGAENWIKALPGLIIQNGDTVRTGSDSGIELTMENGDRALLRELTEIQFSPVRKQQEKTNLLKLLQGKVISIIRRMPNRDIRYRIQTPTAVSLVRGTRFRTKITEDEKTVFEVLEGEVGVESDAGEITLEDDFGIKL